jgi:hypothetical protein
MVAMTVYSVVCDIEPNYGYVIIQKHVQYLNLQRENKTALE